MSYQKGIKDLSKRELSAKIYRYCRILGVDTKTKDGFVNSVQKIKKNDLLDVAKITRKAAMAKAGVKSSRSDERFSLNS